MGEARKRRRAGIRHRQVGRQPRRPLRLNGRPEPIPFTTHLRNVLDALPEDQCLRLYARIESTVRRGKLPGSTKIGKVRHGWSLRAAVANEGVLYFAVGAGNALIPLHVSPARNDAVARGHFLDFINERE